MKFRKLDNCGRLGIDFENLIEPCEKKAIVAITEDFLSKLVKNSILRATDYSDKTARGNKEYRDYIYRHSEKQLSAVVCPSLADIAPIFLIEQPSKRKPRGKDAYTGHIDYRASYRRVLYIIELKYARFTYGMKPPETIAEKFTEAINQIKDIKRDEMEFLCHNRDKWYIKIALEWITFKKGSWNREKLTALDDEKIIKSFNGLRKTPVLKTANMFSLWLPEKRLRTPIEYRGKYCRKYPAVALIAKVL